MNENFYMTCWLKLKARPIPGILPHEKHQFLNLIELEVAGINPRVNVGSHVVLPGEKETATITVDTELSRAAYIQSLKDEAEEKVEHGEVL